MPNPTLSIVICTHNRADLARDAIASVLTQDFPKNEYELLIVDNASTDHTHTMAQEFCDAHPNVRYILETKIGLSHARNRGWQEVHGRYIGYLDDDAKASSDWLSTAHDIAEKIRPEAFGGPYYAFYNSPKPIWFKDKYGSSVQGNIARSLNDNEYVSGGNMFIRRDVLSRLGGFHSNLGMKGEKKGYGEETDFFVRLRSKIKDSIIYYDPKVFIYHLVRPEKLGIPHIISASFVGGRQYYNIMGYDDRPRIFSIMLAILGAFLEIIRSLTWGTLRRDHKTYPFPQNHIYERTTILIFRLGYQFERLKSLFRASQL